jgi:hypothetical protein
MRRLEVITPQVHILVLAGAYPNWISFAKDQMSHTVVRSVVSVPRKLPTSDTHR